MDDELLPSTNYSVSRRSTKPSSNQTNNEILKTYQVNAFKYVNKKYESIGKVGLALLGSRISNNFNILVYGKNNINITQVNVRYEFDITSPEELYVSFYDVNSENWSLRFDSVEYFNDFLSRICIYKMMSSNKPEMIIIDLKTGSGSKVQESDFCEIELTINTVKNCEVSSIIYSSENQDALRTQIGSNKLMQAVEKGLVGMLKGGYRVIGVPFKCPLLKGGSISIPSDTNIIVFIKLVRSKSKIDKPAAKPNIIDDEIPLPDLEKTDLEVDGIEKTKKADLMKRMAKMVLPVIPTHAPESATSDLPVINTNYLQSNHPGLLPTQNNVYSVYDTNMLNKQLLPVQSVNSLNQINQMSAPNPMNPIISQIHNVPVSTDFSVLFTETRQNNTEMRVGMSKLQDKIDKILEKLDSARIDDRHRSQIPTRHLDAENVFENIRRIINDNESLKLECSQKSDTIEKQNRRINEMLRNSQLCLEESHDVFQLSAKNFSVSATEHEAKVLKLEEEKLSLLRNLHQKTSEVGSLEQKLEQVSNECQSYRTKSLEFNEQLDKMNEEASELKLKNRSLQTELSELKSVHHSESVTQAELESRSQQWADEEAILKKKLDLAKTQIQEASGKIRKLQLDCDAEMQQSHKEVEEWQTKLKEERDRMKKKTDELTREMERNNQSWEQRLDEFREQETEKSGKLSDRNSQLMVENAGLRRQIVELHAQISISGKIQSGESDELQSKVLKLSEQLAQANEKLDDSVNVKRQNDELLSEIHRLKLIVDEFGSRRPTYEALESMNADMAGELAALQKLYSKLIETQMETTLGEKLSERPESVLVEEKIKKIMNDVFKQIKTDIVERESYSGEEVIHKCLIIIRDITMENIRGHTGTTVDDYEDESESEEDEPLVKDMAISNLLLNEAKVEENEPIKELENQAEHILEYEPIKELENQVGHSSEYEPIPTQSILITPPDLNLGVGGDQSDPNLAENQDPVLTTESRDAGIDIESFKVSNFQDKVEDNDSDRDNFKMELDHNLDDRDDNFYSFMQVENINGEQSIGIEETLPVLNLASENSEKSAFDGIEACEVVESADFVPTESLEMEISERTVPIDDEVPDVGSEKVDTIKQRTSNERKQRSPLSSDEDEDVLDFFEKLSQKKKPQESQKTEKPKTSFVSDIDDDLSWLNN